MGLEEGRRVAEIRRQESESRLRRLQKQQARWGTTHEQCFRRCSVPDVSVFTVIISHGVLLSELPAVSRSSEQGGGLFAMIDLFGPMPDISVCPFLYGVVL